jgi:hypothetical protein
MHKVTDTLMDSVLEQIRLDVEVGDYTAILELLRFVPKDKLIGFLPEGV